MNEIPLNNVMTYTKFLFFFSSLYGELESICVILAYTFCSPRVINLISLMFSANKYAASINVKYVITIHLLILFFRAEELNPTALFKFIDRLGRSSFYDTIQHYHEFGTYIVENNVQHYSSKQCMVKIVASNSKYTATVCTILDIV
ncbi:hypothetical protein MUS_2048 [Bacillus velezensis YAU B9601-Y2]|uniref:Uncharacterized protein n=1 Tax=Bacillus amyloliquefaciens (strain Y2) TaxID=1155777 RepID=I2C5T8_BACAY|nr:hypothetical protein MUS_2048 [Bacillus velezensis YAU B9601-Y2]